MGWSPFDFGSWYYDPVFGWSFLGGQPWGWLPYHYGGWLFRPGVGWVWSPTGPAGGVGRWRPVTGVWMRSPAGVAIVPSHPLDVKGRLPLNLSSGLFAVTARGVSGRIPDENGEQWKVEKKPASDLMLNQLATVAAPAHLPRTMAARTTAGSPMAEAGDRRSTIVYDQAEKRFVNSSNWKPVTDEATKAEAAAASRPATSREEQAEQPPAARSVAPVRASPTPPSVPRSVTTERVFHESAASEGAHGGATAGGASARAGSSTASLPAPAAASSGARAAGGTSSAGGRPH